MAHRDVYPRSSSLYFANAICFPIGKIPEQARRDVRFILFNDANMERWENILAPVYGVWILAAHRIDGRPRTRPVRDWKRANHGGVFPWEHLHRPRQDLSGSQESKHRAQLQELSFPGTWMLSRHVVSTDRHIGRRDRIRVWRGNRGKSSLDSKWSLQVMDLRPSWTTVISLPRKSPRSELLYEVYKISCKTRIKEWSMQLF